MLRRLDPDRAPPMTRSVLRSATARSKRVRGRLRRVRIVSPDEGARFHLGVRTPVQGSAPRRDPRRTRGQRAKSESRHSRMRRRGKVSSITRRAQSRRAAPARPGRPGPPRSRVAGDDRAGGRRRGRPSTAQRRKAAACHLARPLELGAWIPAGEGGIARASRIHPALAIRPQVGPARSRAPTASRPTGERSERRPGHPRAVRSATTSAAISGGAPRRRSRVESSAARPRAPRKQISRGQASGLERRAAYDLRWMLDRGRAVSRQRSSGAAVSSEPSPSGALDVA